MLDEHVDGLVGQRVVEVGGPVVPEPLGEPGLDQRLHGDVGHGLDEVNRRRAPLTQRRDHALGFVDGPRVRDEDRDDRMSLHLGRDEWRRWCGDEGKATADLVGCREHEVAVEAEQVGSDRRGVDEHAREDEGRKRVEAEVERGDDTEVAATTAHTPEQFRIRGLRRDHLAPVGGDHLDLDEIVAREPELPLDPTAAAAEGESGDARRRCPSTGDDEAVLTGRGIELTPGEPALGAHGTRLRVDVDALHAAQVDAQAAVDDGRTGDAVTTAVHRQRHALLARDSQPRPRRRRPRNAR